MAGTRPSAALAWRLAAGLILSVMGSRLCQGASPSEVRLHGAETRFAPGDLGGVTRILRYTVAQPDGGGTEYVFLTEGGAGELPQAVQVVGEGGEMLRLSDVQGADCTLDHVRVFRRPDGGGEVVYAARAFGGSLARDVTSEPAPMQVSVFVTRPARDPGDSEVVLKLAGPPRRSRPVCRLPEVEREMTRLSAGEARRP